MSGDSVEGGHRGAGRDLSCAPGLGDAARAMSAQLHGDPAATFRRVSTDSRSVSAGDLFFCLRGPSFDGHDFIAAVAETGAAGIVCERAQS
ncbi:MAG: Mur ligase domain-containing protein, partial [Candidatus Binatia bacterium]